MLLQTRLVRKTIQMKLSDLVYSVLSVFVKSEKVTPDASTEETVVALPKEQVNVPVIKQVDGLDKELTKSICNLDFLHPLEGSGPKDSNGNFKAYVCPAGVITIAYGFTFDEQNNKIKLGDVWTYSRAVNHGDNILTKWLDQLLKLSPNLRNEPPKRVAAILSWCYNLGLANYKQSTFKQKIDVSDWDGASKECLRWNKSNGKVLKGLTKRREYESIAIKTGM